MKEKSPVAYLANTIANRIYLIIAQAQEFHKSDEKHYEVDLTKRIRNFLFTSQQSLSMITFPKDFIFIQDLNYHYLDNTESFLIIYEKERVIINSFSFLFDFSSVIFQVTAFIRTLKHISLITSWLNIP